MRISFSTENAREDTRALVERANDYISIGEVLRRCGIFVPKDLPMGTSFRCDCPFDYTHPDLGASRAMRIFADSNAAYCFAENQRYTPVWLWATYRDIPTRQAAEELIDEFNIPQNIEELREDEHLNEFYLAEALKVYCARVIPDWKTRQLDDPVIKSNYLKLCTIARKVSTDEDAKLWLDTAKRHMKDVVDNYERYA